MHKGMQAPYFFPTVDQEGKDQEVEQAQPWSAPVDWPHAIHPHALTLY